MKPAVTMCQVAKRDTDMISPVRQEQYVIKLPSKEGENYPKLSWL